MIPKMKHPLKILALILLLISCKQIELDEERIIGIGKKLTQTEFSQPDFKQILDLVNVGNGLRNEITELQRNATEFAFGTKVGDFENPFGDNKADGILTIKTDYKYIGIRLIYDKGLDKYHILGWKTIDDYLK